MQCFRKIFWVLATQSFTNSIPFFCILAGLSFSSLKMRKKKCWDRSDFSTKMTDSGSHFLCTLLFYQIEPLKNGHSPVLPFGIARNS